MCDDPVEDAVGAMGSDLASDNLFPALPSPRGSKLRRRAALGGMVSASGVLFTLPWLMSKRPGSLPQAGNEQIAQVAQPGSGASPPLPPSPTIADARTFEPPDIGDTFPNWAEQPKPEVQPVVVGASSPPQAAPTPPPHPALPVARPGEGRAIAFDAPVLFRGPIFNETMRQGGHVRIVLHRQAPAGAITARFDASQGLSGTGLLAGRMSESGQITVSGQLLMGKNPFMCDLEGTLNGDMFAGSASFVRSGSSRVYHSRFNLVRT